MVHVSAIQVGVSQILWTSLSTGVTYVLMHNAVTKMKLNCKFAARSMRVLVMASPHDI